MSGPIAFIGNTLFFPSCSNASDHRIWEFLCQEVGTADPTVTVENSYHMTKPVWEIQRHSAVLVELTDPNLAISTAAEPDLPVKWPHIEATQLLACSHDFQSITYSSTVHQPTGSRRCKTTIRRPVQNNRKRLSTSSRA